MRWVLRIGEKGLPSFRSILLPAIVDKQKVSPGLEPVHLADPPSVLWQADFLGVSWGLRRAPKVTIMKVGVSFDQPPEQAECLRQRLQPGSGPGCTCYLVTSGPPPHQVQRRDLSGTPDHRACRFQTGPQYGPSQPLLRRLASFLFPSATRAVSVQPDCFRGQTEAPAHNWCRKPFAGETS